MFLDIMVDIKEQYLWHRFSDSNITLWLKGYIHNKTTKQLLLDFATLELTDIKQYLLCLDGHFAVVVEALDWTIAAVDKVCSIPLFYSDGEVNAHALSLVKNKNLQIPNKNAVLALKMSGYTIGEDAIYQGLNNLIAGQCVVFDNNKSKRITYYQYQPWQVVKRTDYQHQLTQITLNILKKMIKSLDGRQVVIPLSAGNDSRLIASGLKHLGYQNVKCYSYGIKGNFESKIAKIIAEKLGYEFKFIALDIKSERKFYKSNEFQEYLKFADNCVAVPYFQSLSTIIKLKHWIDKDAIFINGNGGDFISGAHIKPSMQKDNSNLDKQQRLDIIFNQTIKKHFSLWGYLKTNKNLDNIKEQLLNEMPIDITTADKDHGIYEYSEIINRQSKYVIGSQRSYEFFGYEWRLPLWDDDYLDFWQQIPLELKTNQKLYIKMLKQENWGSVWGDDIPVNDKTIRPLWIIPLRFLAKIPFIFLGKKRWHQFEINFFYYFLDVTRMMCTTSYLRVIKDILKKPLHHVSWQSDDYLKSKFYD